MTVMTRLGVLLAVSQLWSNAALADSSSEFTNEHLGDTFLNPPGHPYGNLAVSPVYYITDEIDVKWQSDMASVDLLLSRPHFTQPGWMTEHWVIGHNISNSRFKWKMDDREKYLRSVKDGEDAVLYFSLSYVDAAQTIINMASHYFNMTATARPKGTSPPNNTEPATPSSPTTPSRIGPNRPASRELSKGAVAGIAVGATLLVLILLAGILLWGLRRRLHRQVNRNRSASDTSSSPSAKRGVSRQMCAGKADGMDSPDSGASSELEPECKIIAELPGTALLHLNPELAGSYTMRRSGDSWNTEQPERLTVPDNTMEEKSEPTFGASNEEQCKSAVVAELDGERCHKSGPAELEGSSGGTSPATADEQESAANSYADSDTGSDTGSDASSGVISVANANASPVSDLESGTQTQSSAETPVVFTPTDSERWTLVTSKIDPF